MFSNFPGGSPGAGLLLLRAALGLSLLALGAAYLLDGQDLTFLIWIVSLLLFVSSILLLVGYLTPLAGGFAGLFSLGCALGLIPEPAWGFLTTRPSAVLAAAIAVALVCLGPGAFSLDARLFGRRE